MYRALLFLLIVFPSLAFAQPRERITVFTADSFTHHPGVQYTLERNWRFHDGDSVGMASNDIDDSQWPTVDPDALTGANYKKPFSGLGWLRLHIRLDSGAAQLSLMLAMRQIGASEIYLDGKNIFSIGYINGKDSSDYFDPCGVPFPIYFKAPGDHVIAVKYANYDAQKNLRRYHAPFDGFSMVLGEAPYLIRDSAMRIRNLTFFYILLFGVFTALSMLHLFLYLYYRVSKTNLYFSIFCLSFGLMFYLFYASQFSTGPLIHVMGIHALILVISGAFLALSGFINVLYSAKKTMLRITLFLSVIPPIAYCFDVEVGFFAVVTLVIFVLVQVITRTVWAMYKRMSGARILGTGVLIFTCFVLGCVFFTLITGSISFTEQTASGTVLIALGILAILSLPVSISLFLAWNFSKINKDLTGKLHEVQVLSEQALEQEQEKKRLLEGQKERLEQEVALRTTEVVAQKEKIERQHGELVKEKKKTDDLLLNILPEEVAAELKEKGYSDARLYSDVTVLFTDFVDFTKAGETLNAKELVDELHNCFKKFDEIISKYNIEKIKTIGDAYLAVSGLPLHDDHHATNVAGAALEIIEFMTARKQQLKERTFDVRIGIHSGSVVAGIVGVKKFAYDIWGDTVNTAARMEQNSVAGKVNISQATFDLVKERFDCTYRGEIKAKNKGEMAMYFIDGAKP